MPRDGDTSKIIGIFITAYFLFAFMLFSSVEDPAKGNLICYIYAQDGTTPIEGATLAIRNVASGKIYTSPKSGPDGRVLLEDIERGFYKMGVLTDEGSFYAQDVVGINIKAGSTETISVSIDPNSQKETKAVDDLFQETDEYEEVLIGYVLEYYPDTGMAEIELIKGRLKKDALVYFRGDTFNFRQIIEIIILDGKEVEEAFEGDIVLVNVKMGCLGGDRVYLCERKGMLPILLITGATAGVIYGITKSIKEEPETSPFKPKR